MLESYQTVFLEKSSTSEKTFTKTFRVPQRLGIFRFIVDFVRPGLKRIDLEEQVSVIQWRHDSFPRFLMKAYPFYLTALLLMGAFAVLVHFLLFSKNDDQLKLPIDSKKIEKEISDEN